jgi:hypothetical protein
MIIFWVAVVNLGEGAQINLENFIRLIQATWAPAVALFLFFNVLFQLRYWKRRTFLFDLDSRMLTARRTFGGTYRSIAFESIEKADVESDGGTLHRCRILLRLQGGETFYLSRRWYDRDDHLDEVRNAIEEILSRGKATRNNAKRKAID